MKRFSDFFKPKKLLFAQMECLIWGLGITGLLVWASNQSETFNMSNSLLFLSGFLAFWLMLRLQISKEIPLIHRLIKELGAAILLSTITAMIIPIVLKWVGLAMNRPLLPSERVLQLLSGPLYLLFRLGRYLWRWWQAKRRKKIAWNLMHIQLSLVTLIAFLLILGGSIYIISFSETYYPYEENHFLIRVILRLVQTILPYLGITAAITLAALIFLLPLTALISYWSVKRFTKRIDDLKAAASELRLGHTSARTAVSGEDEITDLQKDFNVMAQSLEETLENLSKERQKVSKLLETRRQLMADVSHELRTPIATIQSYLTPLVNNPMQDKTAIQQDLQTIQTEIERLSHLIDDLFTLSKLESRQLTLTIQSADLCRITRQMANTFKPLAWRSGRVEIITPTTNAPCWAFADPNRLEQVLANLIRNAIRHTPPGGIIALQVEEIDNAVHIRISDTGEGIAPEDLPHIWDRFFQNNKENEHKNQGAGLGLALVKEFVEAMGGKVTVSSQLGEGSEFTIQLKAAQGDHLEKTTR